MDSLDQRFISKPPVITEKVTKKEFLNIFNNTNKYLPFDKRVNVQDEWISCLQSKFESFLDDLAKDEVSIVCENSGLFALLYHYEHQHNEKYIQNMKGVGKCIRNYDEVRLTEILADVIQMLSQNLEAPSKKKIYLPSVKYFKYLLMRLIACFRLFLKLATYCYEAAFYLTQKIAIGHVYMSAAVFLGIMGRMRVLSLDMANLIANHFDSIMPFYFALKISSACTTDDEGFPKLVEELRNFVYVQCECQDSITLAERMHEKKLSKISRKLNKRLRKFNEAHLPTPELSVTAFKCKKRKSRKRKLGEVDNSSHEAIENTSSGFFYKEVSTKKRKKNKKRN